MRTIFTPRGGNYATDRDMVLARLINDPCRWFDVADGVASQDEVDEFRAWLGAHGCSTEVVDTADGIVVAAAFTATFTAPPAAAPVAPTGRASALRRKAG